MDPVTVETQAPHRGSGHRFIDIAVSIAALVTSITSIALAITNVDQMGRLVAANSWPFPTFINSNFDADEQAVSLSIKNSGLGPAKIETVVMRYNGRIVHNWLELVRACCAAAGPSATEAQLLAETDGQVLSSGPTGRVLLPGESANVLRVTRSDANATLWAKLDNERFKLTMDACYCSVFDDCWRSNLRTMRPTPVAECRPNADSYQG